MFWFKLRWPLVVFLASIVFLGCSHRPYSVKNKLHSLVTIRSVPDSAHIYIDGKLIGRSPLAVDLAVVYDKETLITAMPMYTEQHRQDLRLAVASVPASILFYMTLPAENVVTGENEVGNTDSDESAQDESIELSRFLTAPVMYFDLDSDQLNSEQLDSLSQFAQALLRENIRQVKLYGHADEQHSEAYNIRLSLRRANRVADHLQSFGLPRSMIQVYGLGEVRIRDADLKASKLSVNRKVNFEVYR